MDNGIYAAATGMLNRARSLDLTGNNIANANTAGYKQQSMTTAAFGESVTYLVSAGETKRVGATNRGCVADSLYTDLSPGALKQTGRSLDFAIEGDGFFCVEGSDGNAYLTRNGNFYVNEEGYLTTASGGYVLGENGRIFVGSGGLSVTPDGSLSVDGTAAGRLQLVAAADGAEFEKRADGNFVYTDGRAAAGQGFAGRSNSPTSI